MIAIFFFGGAGYPNYLDEQGILVKHGRQYARLISRYTHPGELVDVGAAAGFILKGFVDSGWSGIGIEPNQKMAEYGRDKFALNITNTSLEEFHTDKKFDLINMIQVIAHLSDIRKALKNASRMIKPGGLVLIETWNKDSWIARIARANWHEYNPPSVLHFFSPRNLDRLMSQYGFQRLAAGRPIKWISGSHAKSALAFSMKSLKLGKSLNFIPNHIVIPYPAADLFWALYKKHQ